MRRRLLKRFVFSTATLLRKLTVLICITDLKATELNRPNNNNRFCLPGTSEKMVLHLTTYRILAGMVGLLSWVIAKADNYSNYLMTALHCCGVWPAKGRPYSQISLERLQLCIKAGTRKTNREGKMDYWLNFYIRYWIWSWSYFLSSEPELKR